MKLELKNFLNRNNLNIQRENDLVLFDYNRIVTFEKDWDELTLISRGLVFNELSGELITYPISKFFNFSESEFQDIYKNIPANEPFIAFEKMDGSCIFISYTPNGWICHTRGSFISDQAIAAKLWFDRNIIVENLNTDYTYIAEWIGPSNKIVINYEENTLILLVVNNRVTGEELSYDKVVEIGKSVNFVVVVKSPFNNIDEAIKLAETLPENKEGWVFSYPRVGVKCKVKGAAYIRQHSLISNLSNKSLWEALKSDVCMVTLLSDIPDEADAWVKLVIAEFNDAYNIIYKQYIDVYSKFIHLTDKAEFSNSLIPYCKANQFNYSIVFALNVNRPDVVSEYIWDSLKPIFKKFYN